MIPAPFPYFGGKRRAAPIVWTHLGDPAGYVEPFAGSAAVLLARPHVDNRRRVETINDLDGWLVNVWRAIQLSPDEVARHAWGPVAEIDYHARLAWLQSRREGLVPWLEGDPEVHDAKAAGWWLTVVAAGIGDPWDRGPWVVRDGDLVKLPRGSAGQGVNRELPHLGNAGQGVKRKLPHLGDAGQGVNGFGLPALEAYMRSLAFRLQRVRITCGSWTRVVKPSVMRAGIGGDGARSVFLDPPYATSGDLYHEGSTTVSAEVRDWCLTADPKWRMALAGYDNEHDELLGHGWRRVAGKSGGGSGYSVRADNGRREGLWLSPACLGRETSDETGTDEGLFEEAAP